MLSDHGERPQQLLQNRPESYLYDQGVRTLRMKEEHMLNGQLKPAYNVQSVVKSYFIVYSSISNGWTDYNTLIPVLEKHQEAFEDRLERQWL